MSRYEPIVKMTWPLRMLATAVAEGRNSKEKRFGAMTYGSVQEGLIAHKIGAWAEVAVSHYFDAPIDTEIYEHGDHGPDIYIEKRPVAIKCTTYWDDPLLRVEIEHFNNQHFYFCTAIDLDGQLVKLVGWATPKMVCNTNTKRFVKNGPNNFVLRREELIQFKIRNTHVCVI